MKFIIKNFKKKLQYYIKQTNRNWIFLKNKNSFLRHYGMPIKIYIKSLKDSKKLLNGFVTFFNYFCRVNYIDNHPII